jgi:hypothetical protein
LRREGRVAHATCHLTKCAPSQAKPRRGGGGWHKGCVCVPSVVYVTGDGGAGTQASFPLAPPLEGGELPPQLRSILRPSMHVTVPLRDAAVESAAAASAQAQPHRPRLKSFTVASSATTPPPPPRARGRRASRSDARPAGGAVRVRRRTALRREDLLRVRGRPTRRTRCSRGRPTRRTRPSQG